MTAAETSHIQPSPRRCRPAPALCNPNASIDMTAMPSSILLDDGPASEEDAAKDDTGPWISMKRMAKRKRINDSDIEDVGPPAKRTKSGFAALNKQRMQTSNVMKDATVLEDMDAVHKDGTIKDLDGLENIGEDSVQKQDKTWDIQVFFNDPKTDPKSRKKTRECKRCKPMAQIVDAVTTLRWHIEANHKDAHEKWVRETPGTENKLPKHLNLEQLRMEGMRVTNDLPQSSLTDHFGLAPLAEI
ncbi:hypothetical protein K439DRAFT_1625684, partial [Ramaria rubella]